jgi:hypothetical protein
LHHQNRSREPAVFLLRECSRQYVVRLSQERALHARQELQPDVGEHERSEMRRIEMPCEQIDGKKVGRADHALIANGPTHALQLFERPTQRATTRVAHRGIRRNRRAVANLASHGRAQFAATGVARLLANH